MNAIKRYKLKNLLAVWPAHTVMTTHWLKQQGITSENVKRYKASGWIESIGEGAFIRVNDKVDWKGAVFGLQKAKPNIFHVGGRTAMDLQGASHYIRFGQDRPLIYTYGKTPLPKWMREYSIKLVHSTMLPPGVGIDDMSFGDVSLQVSSRERAMLELIEGIGKLISFDEANLIMQNMVTLRPDLVQSLLELCSSIKAKRVFLFLAYRNQHNWYERVNLSKVDLGTGARQIVKKGHYDAMFKITYPKEV